jgi:hypothetical protein
MTPFHQFANMQMDGRESSKGLDRPSGRCAECTHDPKTRMPKVVKGAFNVSPLVVPESASVCCNRYNTQPVK